MQHFYAKDYCEPQNSCGEIWRKKDRENLIKALKLTRQCGIAKNNWSLFPAIIEAAMLEFTGNVI